MASRNFDELPPDVEVGVFWDFENVRIPSGFDATFAANKIRDAVLRYGRIVEQRLYFDSRKASEKGTDRVNLDLSGFTLVDCPTRGSKEAVDKKLIVDLMRFAYQHERHRIKCYAVLITSDGDYCYSLSCVRQLGIKTVVIYGENTHTAGALIDNTDIALTWRYEVLGDGSDLASDESDLALGTLSLAEVEGDDACAPCDRADAGKGGATMGDTLDDDSRFENAIDDALDGRHLLLCNVLKRLQMSRAQSWIHDMQVAAIFHQKRGSRQGNVADKLFYKEARDSAMHGRFIDIGRRRLATGVIENVTAQGHGQDMQALSLEIFLRLTPEGLGQLQDPFDASQKVVRDWQGDHVDPSTSPSAPTHVGEGSSSTFTSAHKSRPCRDFKPGEPESWPRGSECTFKYRSELTTRPRVLKHPCRHWNGRPGSCMFEVRNPGVKCSFFHDPHLAPGP